MVLPLSAYSAQVQGTTNSGHQFDLRCSENKKKQPENKNETKQPRVRTSPQEPGFFGPSVFCSFSAFQFLVGGTVCVCGSLSELGPHKLSQASFSTLHCQPMSGNRSVGYPDAVSSWSVYPSRDIAIVSLFQHFVSRLLCWLLDSQ